MGTVFRARDPLLRRRTAVKRLFPDEAASRQARERVLAEARAMARIEHPHVVKIFDVGHDRDGPFIAMELLEGPTVATWLATRPRWREVAVAFEAAARGLAAIHAAGLVHNDVKPDNLMFTAHGDLRVMDLGLAERARTGDPQPGRTPAGSVRYMAPELFEGEPGTAKSDQFGFCVALAEALTGRCPFASTTPWGHWFEVREGKAPAQRGLRGIPSSLARLIARGLHVDPDRRFANMTELAGRLRQVTTRRSLAARGIVVAGACGVLVAASPSNESVASPSGDRCAPTVEFPVVADAQRRLDRARTSVAMGSATAGWRYLARRLDNARAQVKRNNASPCATTEQHAVSERLAASAELVLRRVADADDDLQPWELAALLRERDGTTAALPADLRHRVERGLASASRELTLGEADRAAARITQLVELADATGSAAAAVEVRLRAHDIMIDSSNAASATQLLRGAAWRASAAGLQEDVVVVALAAAHDYAVALKDPDAAASWIERARVAMPASPRKTLVARMHAERALLASVRHDAELAEQQMRHAARLRRQFAPDASETAMTLSAVGAMLQQQGKFAEALPWHEEAAASLAKSLDPAHPALAIPYSGVASSLLRLGHFRAAERIAKRILALELEAYGPHFPMLAADYLLLAGVAKARGKPVDAREYLARAQDAATRLPEGHPLAAEIDGELEALPAISAAG